MAWKWYLFLGLCLNLTDYNSTDILKQGYEMLKMKCEISGVPLPENKYGRSKTDLLLRDLAGFVEKTHTQLCIINPNCIKGYFAPRSFDTKYAMP